MESDAEDSEGVRVEGGEGMVVCTLNDGLDIYAYALVAICVLCTI